MRCLVFAYSEIGAIGFETLRRLGDEIVGVVTHADSPGEERWWRSVADMAGEAAVPVIMPADPNDAATLQWGRDRRPDILFSFYYRQLLASPWLTLAPLGAYNLHGSLLPKFRGRAPVNWAILEGAAETGLTLHEMVQRADAGDIIDQALVSIQPHETAREVFQKLLPRARLILERSVPLLREGRAPRRAQDPSEATTFGARRPDDGLIDWEWPATRVHNLVRAVTRPYPGAFTFLGSRKIFIWKSRVATGDGVPGSAPGDVLAVHENGGFQVACGEDSLLVDEAEFAAGASPDRASALKVGVRLGKNL